jgi:hypothetical protein
VIAARHTRAVDATTVTVRRRVGAVGRGLLGAVSLVGGLTWMLLNLDRLGPATDLIVGAVLATGGLVLLMPHRVRLPGRATAAATAGAALVGTVAGSLAVSAHTWGMYAYVASRGWPYDWLARGATAEDPATARQLADRAGWQVDAVNLAGDLYFWAFVGLLAVAVAGRVHRTGSVRRDDHELAPRSMIDK